MRLTINRIQKLIAIHGLSGIFKMCVATALWSVSRSASARQSARSDSEHLDSEFDLKWGVDTCGSIVVEKSEVSGTNWIYGVNYGGCNATNLGRVLSEIQIEHELFTFVDFGSGKGRAILTASLFPFRKIIGVEYSERLNEIARQNVQRFPDDAKKCKEIDIVCCDAAGFPIPDGPLVIFLCCPFGKQVMKQVIANMSISFQRQPRAITVIYFNPLFGDMWKHSGFMKETRSSKHHAIYQTDVCGTPGSV